MSLLRANSADGVQPILLKNSPRQFGLKNFGHEKAIAVEFITATSFNTTLVAERFLKIGAFLSTERADRVFQQNRPEAVTHEGPVLGRCCTASRPGVVQFDSADRAQRRYGGVSFNYP